MTNGTPTVCVLLSAYNGADYIKEQIESILSQRGVCIQLIVRDDGSTDNTRDIVNSYANSHYNVKLCFGQNLGFANSFMDLLYNAPDADYYAFSDQDDVWLENKLLETISGFKKEDVLLSFCNAFTTDENLSIKGILYPPEYKVKNKYTCFDDTIANGCLLVFSRAARNLICQYRGLIPVSHDTWVCSICSFVGNINYCPNQLSLYRRHNQATTKNDNKHKIRGWINKIKDNKHPGSDCARLFVDYYLSSVPDNDQKYLLSLSRARDSFLERIKLFFNSKTRRSGLFSTIKLKFKILFNRF